MLVGGQFITSILNQAPDLFKEILVTLTEAHRSILQSTVMLTIQSQQQQQTVGPSQSYPSRPNEFNNITDNKAQKLNNSNNNSTSSNKPVIKMMINMDKYKK
jgi:ABC-type antimicrobial peptide transport system permease subunit